MDAHTDEITDCVEIMNPLCIATSSKDRTIAMFDLNAVDISNETGAKKQGLLLRRFKGQHEKGILKLRYQGGEDINQILSGSHMISISNEIFANVWAPDVHMMKVNEPAHDAEQLEQT